jgi:hypothetical protein
MKADSIHAVNDMSLTRDSARPRRRGPEHSYRLYSRVVCWLIISRSISNAAVRIIAPYCFLLFLCKIFDKIFRDITKVLPNKQQLFFQRCLNIYIDDFF